MRPDADAGTVAGSIRALRSGRTGGRQRLDGVLETVVSRLLEQFEQGTLSRRKLVQSLAIAATGAHALQAAAPAAAAERTSTVVLPRTAWLDHVSYGVADYGRSRDFYADLLGWEVTADDPERGEARLRIGDDLGDITIRNRASPPGRGPTGVVSHICWGLDTYDTDGVRQELEGRGLNPRRDQGGRYDPLNSYHVLDPDGWDVQLAVRLWFWRWRPTDEHGRPCRRRFPGLPSNV